MLLSDILFFALGVQDSVKVVEEKFVARNPESMRFSVIALAK